MVETHKEKLLKEDASFWLNMLSEITKKKTVTIRGIPSVEFQKQMADEEKSRIEAQRSKFGENGLKELGVKLERSIAENEMPVPPSVFENFPVPKIDGIKFHDLDNWNSSQNVVKFGIDLSQLTFNVSLTHVKTEFVYLRLLLDANSVPGELREFLPLFTELLTESPMTIDGKVVPHEDVIQALNEDTIEHSESVGVDGSNFFPGAFSGYLCYFMQVERSKVS